MSNGDHLQQNLTGLASNRSEDDETITSVSCSVKQIPPLYDTVSTRLGHESDSRDVSNCNGGTSPNVKEIETIDYQQIVDKLHKLGNETLDLDNPQEDPTTSLNQESSGQVYTNGMLSTPPSTPVSNDSQQVHSTKLIKDTPVSKDEHGIGYIHYQSEHQMPDIMSLISKDLSEPYSIYTYRYFIHNWPDLCFLAIDGSTTVGAIVCKLDPHKRTMRKRGYIAMLAVDHSYRRKKIGSKLVSIAIDAMIEHEADEVVLETEVTNLSALRLYEKLGFVRDKRLYKYYLNGVDAFRLKLWLT